MFKNNKYTELYYKIINKSKLTPKNSYTEMHHIIPRCLGGTDEAENLVELTYREHYICHYLLTKMHDSRELVFALWAMSNQNKSKYYRSRIYDAAKKIYIDSISGDNHWAKDTEHKKKMSESWNSDRKKNFSSKVSGDNHWTRKRDMSEHARKMRESRDIEAESKAHSLLMKGRKMNFSQETIKKLKQPKVVVECPHCGKAGGKPVMKRYHFEKCKYQV